jgi:hypothetical protein
VVGLVIWTALCWVGYSLHDDLGVVSDIGRGVARWWEG